MKNVLYIVWSDNNKLGIPIIDEQHRGIVSTINSLHYFMQTGHGREIIKPTLITVQQYTDIHFRTEEALMTEAGYPAFDEHAKLHRELMDKTRRLSVDANRHKDPIEVLRFLKGWWLAHISKEDRKYTPFLTRLVGT